MASVLMETKFIAAKRTTARRACLPTLLMWALLREFLEVTELTRLELHGTDEELAKLHEPLAAFNPTYFRLEYAFRR